DMEIQATVSKMYKIKDLQRTLSNTIEVSNVEIQTLQRKGDAIRILEEVSINFKDSALNVAALKEEETEIQEKVSSIKHSIKLFEDESDSLRQKRIDLRVEMAELNKDIKNYINYESKEILQENLETMKAKFNVYSNDESAKSLKEIDEDYKRSAVTLAEYDKELDEFSSKIALPHDEILKISVGKEAVTLVEIEKTAKRDLDGILNKMTNVKQKESYEKGRASDLKKNIHGKFDGKEPCLNEYIVEFNFKDRLIANKKELQDVYEIIDENKNKIREYESELRVVLKYRVEGKGIVCKPKDLLVESKRLLEQLATIEKKRNESITIYDRAINEINVFNVANGGKFKKIAEGINACRDEYRKQEKSLENTQLYISEAIDKVDGHAKHLNSQKSLISRQVKEYVEDCVRELSTINALGKRKGNLFRIHLPGKEELAAKILQIDALVDTIVGSYDQNEVKNKINTFYLLNYTIGIANIKVTVKKYELNNRHGVLAWNDIPNKTTGAQRFCIAFIITVILLEYRRQDKESPSGKSRHDGKVLIMDNPFGETSEKDFLVELFELAKRFNVQIVSYTHITNESVRKCFKKLYTMTVETTTSGKEIVKIEKPAEYEKRMNGLEDVVFNPHIIGLNREQFMEQETLFDVVNESYDKLRLF
ncbi:MAG: hypothetical protein ACRC30_00490, partial [Clostridium sp.]